MSDQAKNITLYTAEDIQRYLRGECTMAEMHAMEKAALDDPFLADAMEGMGQETGRRPGALLDQDLLDLRQRMATHIADAKEQSSVPSMESTPGNNMPRTGTGRIRSLYPMRIAAAIILLLGLGFGAYYLLVRTPLQKHDIATVHNKNEESASADAVASTPSAAMPSAASIKPPASNPPAEANPAGSATPAAAAAAPQGFAKAKSRNSDLPNSGDRDLAADTEKEVLRKSTAKKTVPALPTADSSNFKTINNVDKEGIADRQMAHSLRTDTVSSLLAGRVPGVKIQDKPNYGLGNRLNQAQMNANHAESSLNAAPLSSANGFNSIFSGTVMDQANRPISNAIVSLGGNDHLNALTNNLGQFQLNVPVKDSEQILKITSWGYEDATIPVANTVDNYIHLRPQTNTLKEVVVTGYGAQRKRMLPDSNRAILHNLVHGAPTVMPVIGWTAYQQYLDTHKKDSTVDTALSGQETISFRVNSKGELSGFRIEKSISTAHDKLAIRLIKKGPAWKLLDGKKSRATISLYY